MYIVFFFFFFFFFFRFRFKEWALPISEMKWKHVIIYKYLMPMIADILILGVTVFELCAACIGIVD